jgi:hypothetical protein
MKIKELISPSIDSLLKKYDIDAVGFEIPSVKRTVQLQKIIPEILEIPLPHIIKYIRITQIISFLDSTDFLDRPRLYGSQNHMQHRTIFPFLLKKFHLDGILKNILAC